MTIMYDLRKAGLPSRKQIRRGLQWIDTNAPRLDKHLQGIAVVLKSLVVRYMLMDWIGWLCPATTQFTTTQTRTRARAYACTRTD